MGTTPTKLSNDCLESFKKEGLTPPQIAKMCGCSRQNVYERFKRVYKIPIKDKKTYDLWRRGRTTLEIATEMGYTRWGALNALRRLKLKPNKKSMPKHTMVILLRNKGHTALEIASELNMQIMTVWQILNKYNSRPVRGDVGRPRGKKPMKGKTFLVKNIPPDVWKKFKMKSIDKGTTMNEMINAFIRKSVKEKHENLPKKRV